MVLVVGLQLYGCQCVIGNITRATDKLAATDGATLDVAAWMMIVARQCAAVTTATSRDAPGLSFVAVFNTGDKFSLVNDVSPGAACGLEHTLTAAFARGTLGV